MDNQEEHWTLDKKVPISLIGAVMFQFAIFIWSASAFNSRVENLERSSEKTVQFTTSSASETQIVKDRVLKVEITIANINDKLEEIKEILLKRK